MIIVGFFTVYTASGMVGGGKLFATAFAGVLPDTGLSDYMLGIVITAGIVLVYTMIGGFLAVSLTDFVQGMIMMVALVVMPLVIFFGSETAVQLSAVPQDGFLSLTRGSDADRHHQRRDMGAGILRSAAYHRALHGHRQSGERADGRMDLHDLDGDLAGGGRYCRAFGARLCSG